MWLYLGIFTTTLVGTLAWYKNQVSTPTDLVMTIRHIYMVTKEVYKVIRQNGLRTCIVWAKQVIANQIGGRLVETHRRYYIIHYPYGITWYKIIVPRRRGPCLIDTVTDGDGNDVKKEVFAFMGPSHNFHGVSVTPKMLGYNTLNFTYLNGEVKAFAETDTISF